jgi:hypothetical protein
VIKTKLLANILIIGVGLALFLTAGCNRAAIRVPGASTSFPDTATHYSAKSKIPLRLVVERPSDRREENLDQPVAGTKWTSSSTDAMWDTDVEQLIQQRLLMELSSSALHSTLQDSASREPKRRT